jgi:hypothetical protein
VDGLGIEPRASRMLSGCDTTTPTALAYCCCSMKHTHLTIYVPGRINNAPRYLTAFLIVSALLLIMLAELPDSVPRHRCRRQKWSVATPGSCSLASKESSQSNISQLHRGGSLYLVGMRATAKPCEHHHGRRACSVAETWCW